LKQENVEEWLDLIEISFRFVDVSAREYYNPERLGIRRTPDDAITELNERFRRAAFGYRFENGQIIRVDSEFVHAEIVKPSLVLLSDKRFSAPQGEYLTAHGHYRAGHFSDAI
jgi:AbiJ N-terminal domain 4